MILSDQNNSNNKNNSQNINMNNNSNHTNNNNNNNITEPNMTEQEIYKHYKISTNQMNQLIKFKNEILQWNQKHNLISRNSEKDIWKRHILNSLQLLDFIPTNTKKLIDIGSGGGFPGIVLSIMLPQTQITLIDSSQKKTNILQQITQTLQINNTQIICDRIENIHLSCDIITARALAAIDKILSWTRAIKYKTMLLLKGQSVYQELTKKCTLHNGTMESFIVEIKR